jgi:hypothetical protein
VRRIIGVILVAVGAFAVVLGLSLRFAVYDRVAVAPLDPDSETVARGSGVTVFYPESFTNPDVPRQRTDATVTATRKVNGRLVSPDVEVGGDVALWRVGLVLEDEQFRLVNAVEQWVCVDRRDAQGVRPCRDQKILTDAGTETDVDFSGLNYKFPFGTERRDYPFFDITMRKATTARYDGEEKINGLETYRFVQRIEPVQLDTREVPGNLVGEATTASVEADRYYDNVRTVWVEPNTGIIVKGQEETRQVLRGPAGGELVVFAGTLTFTPETIRRQVEDAQEGRDGLRLISDVGPKIAWALGLLLLLAGLLLLFAGRGAPARYRDRPVTTAEHQPQHEVVG